MNLKNIIRIMAALLFIEAAFLCLCLVLSIYYNEDDTNAFLYTIGTTVISGIIFMWIGKGAEKKMTRKEGYFTVSISWIVVSIFGMLPYYLSDYIPTVTDAFFETMSGFSTTGATILDNIESLPHGLLFWRSLTQWIGGLGIVFFTIAVLPIFGVGGVKLFAAESTGVTFDKVHPRIGVTARWIWTVYILLTIAETILLRLGNMSLFDSICHAFTTTATGGYSTKQASIIAFDSAYIEYVIIVFMFLSGINFTLLYMALLRGKIKRLLCDTEFHWYAATVIFFSSITALMLYITTDWGTEESIRKALFQIISLQTTTGYVSSDYMTWAPPLWSLLCITMLLGACAGSTTGGIKCIRIAIMSRVASSEFKHIVHPNATIPVKINNQVISTSTKSTVLAFIYVYITILFIGWLWLSIMGLGFEEAYSVMISSLGNVGPGIGKCGPAYSWSALPAVVKWTSSFLMLIGRLELFTVLLLFTSYFWKRY